MAINGGAFVFYALCSRILGVERYGELFAVTAIFAILSVPSLVASTVATKMTAEQHALREDQRIGALAKAIGLWFGAAGLVIVAAGLLLRPLLAGFFHMDSSAVLPAALLVAFAVVALPLRAVLQGAENFRAYAISCVLEGILKTVFGVSLALAGFGVAGAVGGYALGYAITLIYTWWALAKRFPVRDGQLHLDAARLFQTAGAAVALTLTVSALSYADALIIKHVATAKDAGLYAAASVIGKILLYAVGFIPILVLPKAAKARASGTSPLRLLRFAVLLWATLSATCLVAVAVDPQLFVRVLVGSAFLAAAPLLIWYGAAMSLLGAMSLIGTYKIALHRFDFVYPFLAVTIIELLAIAVFHPNLQTVVMELVAGNLCGTLCGLYGISAWKPARAGEAAV